MKKLLLSISVITLLAACNTAPAPLQQSKQLAPVQSSTTDGNVLTDAGVLQNEKVIYTQPVKVIERVVYVEKPAKVITKPVVQKVYTPAPTVINEPVQAPVQVEKKKKG